MGDEADYTLDQMFDDFNDEFDDEDSSSGEYIHHPTCRGCKSRNVDWKENNGQWYLVNHGTGKPHKCGKYELPIEILKVLAEENLKSQKSKREDKLFEKTMKWNGIYKITDFATNEELLNLYTRWVEYARSEENGGSRIYDGKIKELKDALMKRFK